jgi:hypothetical protein
MANITEPSNEQLRSWKSWVEERPPAVRMVAERLKPWKLYRMKSTGQRVTVYSISEPPGPGQPCTVTVDVGGAFNLVTFERRVFGVLPDDLGECDLPTEDEPTGVLFTEPADIATFVENMRHANKESCN